MVLIRSALVMSSVMLQDFDTATITLAMTANMVHWMVKESGDDDSRVPYSMEIDLGLCEAMVSHCLITSLMPKILLGSPNVGGL